MRPVAFLMFAAFAGPAMALPQSVHEPEGLRIYSPTQFGEVAETPSRMAGSREEMNRGRNTAIGPSVQALAADAVARTGLVCAVAEAAVIGRTRDGGPLIEIDCVEGGGVIIADSDPLQVTDCLDLVPDTGQAGRRQRIVSSCTLPGNLGLAERSQSARN
ncbi:hypothetical protein [Brevundimonas sp.]|uniref:hypothetical protein n=1 Tax=Brevundimonas sp. TaxID=1871086 RepID=UPI003F6E9EE0